MSRADQDRGNKTAARGMVSRTAVCSAAAAALLLATCDPILQSAPTAGLPPAQPAAPGEFTIYRAGAKPPGHFVDKGAVKGYACNMVVTDSAATFGRALEHAKQSALLLGADAIIGFSCTLAGTNTTCTDCWNCTECNGTAVKLIQKGAAAACPVQPDADPNEGYWCPPPRPPAEPS
jgi:hypothetical protein